MQKEIIISFLLFALKMAVMEYFLVKRSQGLLGVKEEMKYYFTIVHHGM